MSKKIIKTNIGNEIEICDDSGSIMIIAEDNDGRHHWIRLSCDDATKIAEILKAFVVINS